MSLHENERDKADILNEEQLSKIEEKIREAGENLNIPKNLLPNQIEEKLKERQQKKKRNRRIAISIASAAAVLALAITTVQLSGINNNEKMTADMEHDASSYSQVYDALKEIEKRQSSIYENKLDIQTETAMEESADMAAAEADSGSSESGSSYSKTNVQVENVDEGDIVKTDGKYIYRMNASNSEVNIVKVNGASMKTVSTLKFSSPSEMYVIDNMLIVLEQGYVDGGTYRDEEIASDMVHQGQEYTTAHIYDIADRKNPKLLNKLTQSGYLKTSRVYDNYLYMITEEYVYDLENEGKPETYIPQVDFQNVSPAKIYIPEGCNTQSYLNITSINLNEPKEFKDNASILASGEYFHMNTKNLYIADSKWIGDRMIEGEETSDTSSIVKFSINKGKIKNLGETTIKGTIMDPFSMDEYEGNLRIVSTVTHYKRERVFDHVKNKILGYSTSETRMDNSLYILDENLNQIGAIEGLAEEERIYSARFMGKQGYFVTFRETDPLFSVDLSDPTNPKILGELKIPGFSEYLHFYDEGLLLGIGQEINENGGREGIKLSMFDISDPTNVVEKDKLVLNGYYDSSALYNYKSVMIDTQKNLFGFSIEGYGEYPEIFQSTLEASSDSEAASVDLNDYREEYAVFSYDKDKGFISRLTLRGEGDYYGEMRGIFINDIFYLIQTNGNMIKAYSLENRELLGKLEK